ncbi:MAG: site-specific integrase, partial [Methanoregulaceae archaeon]
IPPEKVVTSDLVRKILECCESQRDRALVSVYWDSAARLNEILTCDIGHVQFDRYGAIISVTGKTGRRPIRLISSVPDLQAWIKMHPLKNDPNAPLFVTSRKRGTTEFRRLNGRTVDNLFKRLGSYVNSGKRTNPHSFRHGRLTIRGKQLTESELRKYAGWSNGSGMAAVYVHLSSRDIDHKILSADGIALVEEPQHDPMAVVPCPRCGRPNSPDAMFCGVCYMALNDEAIQELEFLRMAKEDPDTLIEVGMAMKKKIDG